MLAAKGLDDTRRHPALRVVARGIPYHPFFVRQLLIEQQRIVPMKALTCHIPAFCPLVGTKHRTVSICEPARSRYVGPERTTAAPPAGRLLGPPGASEMRR